MSLSRNNVSHVLSRPKDSVGGRVEVCVCRISQDSAGAGLRRICLDLIFIHLLLGVYKFASSNLRFTSSALVASLVRWSYETLAR